MPSSRRVDGSDAGAATADACGGIPAKYAVRWLHDLGVSAALLARKSRHAWLLQAKCHRAL